VLCLDFGTASAKVGALRGGRAPLPLRLGDDGDFAVDASAYLDAGGGLAFGSLARQRSLEEGRPRLDSLKRLLGRVPLDRPLDALPFEALGVRGGGAASLGLVLRVYLAWLVHRARTALAAHHGIEGPAPLRFALPCWPSARWLALEPAIGRLVAEAILLADTLGPELEDGVDVREARHLAQLAAETPRIPAALVGRSIMEPVAAAASRFGPEAPARGLVLVVDVGAGTTDLALFTLEADPDRGRFEICPVEGGTDLVPRAGDHLDRALGQIALERLQGEHRPPRSLRAQIALRARAWKERLVADGAIELDLGRGARLEREELFEHPEVADLEPRLRARARALLEQIPRSRLEPLAAHGLTVCLAGGGASLPMVASLVRGATTAGDITLEHRPGPALPPFVRDRPDLARDYPRLAVCLGGASGYLPRHAAPAFRS
jgi:molecular chaperone HscA